MADGADLLVADVAAELNIPIIAVLPMSHEQCRADLERRRRARYSTASTHAVSVSKSPSREQGPSCEPQSTDERRDLQFQRAGALVARYSALLIAIWDGKDTEHRRRHRAGRGVSPSRHARRMATSDPLPVHMLLSAQTTI